MTVPFNVVLWVKSHLNRLHTVVVYSAVLYLQSGLCCRYFTEDLVLLACAWGVREGWKPIAFYPAKKRGFPYFLDKQPSGIYPRIGKQRLDEKVQRFFFNAQSEFFRNFCLSTKLLVMKAMNMTLLLFLPVRN